MTDAYIKVNIADSNLNIKDYDISDPEDLRELEGFLKIVSDAGLSAEEVNIILDLTSSLEEAGNMIRDGEYMIIYTRDRTDASLGDALAEERGLNNEMSETIAQYFDYQKFGRDYRIEYNGEWTKDGREFIHLVY